MSDGTIELTRSDGAKWREAAPPVANWLPLLAHLVLSALWWAIYVHRVRLGDVITPLFWAGLFSGSVVWPIWGGAQLVRTAATRAFKITGWVYLFAHVWFFFGVLPGLVHVG